MSTITIVIVVAICGVLAVAAAGRGLDRRRPALPEAGSPHAMPLPNWLVGLVVVAAATGAIAAGAGIASSWG